MRRTGKVFGPRELNGFALGNGAQIFDEIRLGSRASAGQNGTEQSAMRFFDRDTLRRRMVAEFFHDRGFNVTDKKLRHG